MYDSCKWLWMYVHHPGAQPIWVGRRLPQI
jgi:hypothetical protein